MTGADRPEPPLAGPPKELVEGFLDFLRATLLWKLDGLSDEDLRRSLVPSGWSLLGMVKHIAYVERSWFRKVFLGETVTFPWTEADPDADWRIEPGETTAQVLDLYRDECARARAIVAAASWDDLAVRADEPRSLGWILTHMVEETARHCGHADLVREQLDGATGE